MRRTGGRSLLHGGLLVLGAGASSCGGSVAEARPQWVVTVTTDAPVPLLGDRLLVELLGADGAPACPGCRRLFGMADASAWPLSFGIPDAAGQGLRLRVRLFRADHSDAGGLPAGGLPIDVLGALPPTGGGPREVAVTLSAACAGVAADVAHGLSCDPTTEALVARVLDDRPADGGPRPGTFPLARSAPCARAAREGMVCIEGGLFVRGSTSINLAQATALRPTPERLVRVSAFAIDRHETTVRDLRALVARGVADTALHRAPSRPACTYTDAAGAFEDFPVNCVPRTLAARACEARGLRLPTEAEWEFAARDRDQEKLYPWGDSRDLCRYAVVGRGRVETSEGNTDNSFICRMQVDAPLRPWGPRPVDEGEDVTALGVRGLGGNVSEWVADTAGSYAGPCSSGPRVLVDPRCDRDADGAFIARGGAWSEPPYLAETTYRSAYPETSAPVAVGFRCAESL